MSRLTLVRNGAARPEPGRGERVLAASELPRWVVRGGALASIGRFAEGRVLIPDLAFAGRPLAIGLLARWCARGACYLEDEAGRRRPLTVGQLARWSGALLREPLQRGALVRRLTRAVEDEERHLGDRRTRRATVDGDCAYFRTDLAYAVKAGGSVGHIAGVLNSLAGCGCRPVFVTTDRVPTVDAAIETHLVRRSERFWHYRELPAMVMHDVFLSRAERIGAGRNWSFIYQRYSLHNFAGVVLARRRQLPLVIEYNGSESWVGRHWGHPLRYPALADRIELLNMRAADLVVVVSGVIRDQLAERGVDPRRILVNPNGVDVDRYRPDVSGAAVRARYGVGEALVVGFIGTFGPWHGAEVLVDAFARLRDRRPDLRDSLRLLMIGDGARAAAARARLTAAGHAGAADWTGLVPQAEGPAHLAACDILVSPHVPNADGSRFFGSPTKLFEYMAMGRAIVASDLDQIGEVLAHDDTGWLVPPGDADALAAGLAGLADRPDVRQRLGRSARCAAVSRWSWREHTRRILTALHQSLGERS